jgi:tripartite-type tricarboxylate transporter receptor subunit TctC
MYRQFATLSPVQRLTNWLKVLPAIAKLGKRPALGIALSASILFALPQHAHSQWPERTVKLVVTFPPGSANDAAARIFADSLSRRWRKPVIIENRVGAEGTIGAAAFVSAQDDHSLLYTVSGTVSVAPLLVDKLSYDSDRDLIPVATTTGIVLTLAVNSSLPIASIDDLLRELKSHSGEYAWASGPGLLRHTFASFLKRHELRMNYATYRDAAQPQADLGEGRIQLLLTSLTASSAPVHAGKARFLAVVNPVRHVLLPDLPTVRELGYGELEVDGLAGLFSSPTMDTALRQRIASDIAAVAREDDVRRKLEAGGHIVLGGDAEQLATTIARQRKSLAELTKMIDIRNPQ